MDTDRHKWGKRGQPQNTLNTRTGEGLSLLTSAATKDPSDTGRGRERPNLTRYGVQDDDDYEKICLVVDGTVSRPNMARIPCFCYEQI